MKIHNGWLIGVFVFGLLGGNIAAESETSCTGTVSSSLELHMPSLNYETLFGTQDIWADFEYLGTNSERQHTWGLQNYGVNTESIIMDYPLGKTRLHVRRNGEAFLFYGALPQYQKIKKGIFDIDELYKQLKTRLHDNVPREEWPNPQSKAGMVTINVAGKAEKNYLIFDEEEFAEHLFNKAGKNIVGQVQKRFIAGPLRYEKNYHDQKETDFFIERIRVGDFYWFPSLLILSKNIPESEAKSYIGKDVLVFGDYTRIPVVLSQLLAISSWPAMVAKHIIPVENKKSDVFSIVGVPNVLDDEETIIKFKIKNPLPHDLDETKTIIDFDGHFQFKDGKRNRYTTHNKQLSSDFKAHEEKEFIFSLIPSDLHRDKGHFAMSIMFLGYYAEDDTIKPVYAFWKKQW
jgi:hypothetical protein